MARGRREVDSSTTNKVEPSCRNNHSTGETSAPTRIPERRESSGPGKPQPPATGAEASSGKQLSEQKNAPEGAGGGGEMDWDMALDTILKTLRKDRVGDTK